MNPANAPPVDEDWVGQEIERWIDRYELAWQEADPPDFARFATDALEAVTTERRQELLEELVKVDLEYRWKAGSTAGTLYYLEDYRRRAPELTITPALIAEEFRVRHRWGDAPPREEYVARFGESCPTLDEALVEAESSLSIKGEVTQISFQDYMMLTSARPVAAPPRSPPAPPKPAAAAQTGEPPLPAMIGRFQIERVLGRGAFGVVYLARDPELERAVAIKVLSDEKKAHSVALAHEARLAARLRHPAIVPIYDVGSGESGAFVVMAYIEGDSLRERLRAGKLPVHEAVRILADVAAAIHEAHKIGLLHRDLKPANILLDAHGQPHITDFGLALAEEQQYLIAGDRSGTPAYMSPEQTRGEAHRLDGRSDVWSIGVMLYEALVGKTPFRGDTLPSLFEEIRRREPKPLRQTNDALEPELEAICLKCLAKEVTQRYATALDLANDLRRYLRRHTHGSTSWHSDAHFATNTMTGSSTGRGAGVDLQPGNLPAEIDTFIGREAEANEVAGMLVEEGASVVALVGTGGIGKTRLALHVAQSCAPHFPGGCWWVDVSQAATAAQVAQAVLEAFGLPVRQELPEEQVVAHLLEYRPPLLLVLDNFEQVAHAAAETIGLWRSNAPQARFFVTTRSSLGLPGVRHFEVEPLAAPPADETFVSPEECAEFDAVRLFVSRAQEIKPTLKLNDANAAAIAEICRQLEGIPLAIELAAARSSVLTPAQIVAKLGQRMQLLRASRRAANQRQQTLESTIEWSFDLLTGQERDLFLQASLLPNGFFLEAAEAVFELGPGDAVEVIDAVQSLREQSLLRASDTPHGLRFSMFESIREFSREKRQQGSLPADATKALLARIASYFDAYAAEWSPRVHTADAPEALDRLAWEIETLRLVQDWHIQQQQCGRAFRSLACMLDVLAARRPAKERVALLQSCANGLGARVQVEWRIAMSQARHAVGEWAEALSQAEVAVHEAELAGFADLLPAARLQQAEVLRARGQLDAALPLFGAAAEGHRAAKDLRGVSRALNGQGNTLWKLGRVEEAVAAYAEAEQLACVAGDMPTEAHIARNRGHLFVQAGDLTQASQAYARAEQIATLLADRRGLHLAYTGQATVLTEQGELGRALEKFRKAERLAREQGEARGIAANLGNQGLVLAEQGVHTAALECYRAAEQLNRQMNNAAGIALNLGNQAVSVAALGDRAAALSLVDEAIRMHTEMGNRAQLAINLADRGHILAALSQTADAVAALENACQLFRELALTHSAEFFAALVSLALLTGRDDLRQEATRVAAEQGYTPAHPRERIRVAVAKLHV